MIESNEIKKGRLPLRMREGWAEGNLDRRLARREPTFKFALPRRCPAWMEALAALALLGWVFVPVLLLGGVGG